MKYIIGHYVFETEECKEGTLVHIHYYENPMDIWDSGPDWGYSGNFCKDAASAAINAVENMMKNESCGQAVVLAQEILPLMYAVGLIPNLIPIRWFSCSRSFVYHGGVWFINFDIDRPSRVSANTLYGGKEITDPMVFQLNAEERIWLGLAWADARAEAESYSRAYNAWEASWIDGCMNL